MKRITFSLVLTLFLASVSTAQSHSDPGTLFPNTTQAPGPGQRVPSESRGSLFEYAVVVDYYSTKKDRSYSEIIYSDGRSENTSSLNKAQILGKLGAEGWELISTSAVQNADSYTYFEKSWLYLMRTKR